jgi:hypothetical protein
MSAVRTVGLLLAIVGAIAALGGAFLSTVAIGGSAQSGTGAGAGGSISLGGGNFPLVALGVCALGVVLVLLGRK